MGIKGIDLTGQTFGRLTVIAAAPSRSTPGGSVQRYWLCRCECGKDKEVATSNLTGGNVKSCGCLRKGNAHNRKDLTGQVFGRLTALRKAPSRQQYGTTVGYWECRCRCGQSVEVPTGNLVQGNSKSCGCAINERKLGNRFAQTHGYTGTPTWVSWFSMRKRCRERSGYADRGIAVDSRWESFENFLADMGERPEGTTLDRIDNNGPYSPRNCRWATPMEQGNNRSTNRPVTYAGKTMTIAQWEREVGLPRNVLYNRLRIYGWDLERALFTPVGRRAS